MAATSQMVTPKWPPYNMTLVYASIALQMFALVGLIAITSTAYFSSKVKRSSIWMNSCVSWIIFCITYLLLFLAGQQDKKPPNQGLCFAQSTLHYGAPVLTACTTLALIVELWFGLHSAVLSSRHKPRNPLWRKVCLIIFPYVAYIGILAEALVFELKDPDMVGMARSGMYCDYALDIPEKVSTIFVSAVMSITSAFTLSITMMVYRNWRAHDRINHGTSKFSRTMIIRTALFAYFSIISIFISLDRLLTARQYSSTANLFLACMPVAAVLIFGTQIDILRAWMFWRKEDVQYRRTRASSPAKGLLAQPRDAQWDLDGESVQGIPVEPREEDMMAQSNREDLDLGERLFLHPRPLPVLPKAAESEPAMAQSRFDGDIMDEEVLLHPRGS